MNSLFNSMNLLQLASPEGGSGSLISTLVMFGLVFLIFYFLIIRPQNKRQKETKNMLEKLKKGDKVQSIGGIQGIVKEVKDDLIIVTVDDSTNIAFIRSAIATVINPEAKAAEKETKKKEKEGEAK